MTEQAPVLWPRELWDVAGRATHSYLARMCPLCPDPNGTTITVDGVGSFTIPFSWNAKSFTITIPAEGDKSTVVWEPCGHVVIVDGRLDTTPERPVGGEETNR